MEKVPFRVVVFLDVRVAAHGLDAFLQGHDLVVAGHYRDGAELKTLCERHGADRVMARCRVGGAVEELVVHSGEFHGALCPGELGLTTDDHGDFVRHHALLSSSITRLPSWIDPAPKSRPCGPRRRFRPRQFPVVRILRVVPGQTLPDELEVGVHPVDEDHTEGPLIPVLPGDTEGHIFTEHESGESLLGIPGKLPSSFRRVDALQPHLDLPVASPTRGPDLAPGREMPSRQLRDLSFSSPTRVLV